MLLGLAVRTEQKFIRLKHIQLIVTQKIHKYESMIIMECTECEIHLQVRVLSYQSRVTVTSCFVYNC